MTLWVKELLNVAHTLFIGFVVSHIHMVYIKSKTFAIGSILAKLVHRNVRFGNAKNSSVFYVNCLLICLSHSSCRNSFISFVCNGKKKLCQIRLFFTIDKQDFASVMLYQIETKHRPSQSTADIYSFFEDRKLENVVGTSC